MDLSKALRENPGVLLSKGKLKGLINDIYQNDLAKVNLLMSAYEVGLVQAIRKSFPLDDFEKNRMVKLLVTQYSIVEKKAYWAVNTWTASFDAALLVEIDKIEQALLSAPVHETFKPPDPAKPQNNELSTRDAYDDYYLNVALDKSDKRIYIPCGIGNSDNGFFIYGIKEVNKCNHKYSNVYALVYNYLLRNSKISDDDIPRCIRNYKTFYKLDYRSIFRLAIIILQMIKNNYLENNVLDLAFDGDMEVLKLSVSMINQYSALFCRIIGIEPIELKIRTGHRGHVVSIDSHTGIYIIDNHEFVSNARELWYGRKINYSLRKEHLPYLEYILSEISSFDSFMEGQFEVLCNMLSTEKHSVCIMPTGSGKSLIFYLASLLQPLPLFIVAPTDILIQDQIRNLQKFHHIDNVSHLKMTSENSFKDFEPRNSLIYLTPTTFQNRDMLKKCRYINKGTKLFGVYEEQIAAGPLISYVVLDEIHCLSNWGHDFRPEYLMLSKHLNRYLDGVTFWGFTATANYTVVEDIQKQLGIPQKNFFYPITFEKFNISYDFRCVETTEEMYKLTNKIVQRLIARNERTIIFTKNDAISYKVADVVGNEADVFTSQNPEAYHHFADGKCKVLVASEELGVGINFPNIRNIIHFGLPVSKSEYAQEVGRAGRANESVTSYVIYLMDTPNNVPNTLLKRNTDIETLPALLKNIDNDYADVYRRLNNNSDSKDILYARLIDIYDSLEKRQEGLYVMTYPNNEIEMIKRHLYMLYAVGYIFDWYTYSVSANNEGKSTDIIIDVSSADHYAYLNDPKKMLNRMRKKASDYFEFMGNYRDSIARIARANSAEEIIRVYVDWYYAKYLYHHKEQFLDFCEFISGNEGSDSEKITNEIKEHFVLPFIEIKIDEARYSEMSFQNICNKVVQGLGKNTLANIERINSNHYSYKLDFLLFCGHLRINGRFDENRLERLLTYVSKNELPELQKAFIKLYTYCKDAVKMEIHNYIELRAKKLDITYSEFLDAVYRNGEKDVIYYGIIAQHANTYFNKIRRSQMMKV